MSAAPGSVHAALRSMLERQFAGYDEGDAEKALEFFIGGARLVAPDGSEHDLRTAVAQALTSVESEPARPRHEVSTVCVDIDGDELVSEAYVNGYVYTLDADGTWHEILHRCRYLDRWTGGPNWKVSHRCLIHDQHLLDGRPQRVAG